MKTIINSDTGLSKFIGELREEYFTHRYIEVTVKNGKVRSIKQNSTTHRWYQQLALELKEYDALSWKCYCKLHHGVAILRSEDDEFRLAYDSVIKPLSYEQKMIAMKCWPVTSIMNKDQLSRYAESVQADFRLKGVLLEFNKDAD